MRKAVSVFSVGMAFVLGGCTCAPEPERPLPPPPSGSTQGTPRGTTALHLLDQPIPVRDMPKQVRPRAPKGLPPEFDQTRAARLSPTIKVPKGVYPFLTEDDFTIAIWNAVVAGNHVSEETVYKFVKAMAESQERVRSIHPTLADSLAHAEHPRQALLAYEQKRLPMTAEIVRSNRRGGPEGVIDAVEQLAPDGFTDIEKVLSYGQREAIVRGYASKAGFAAPTLGLAAVR